MKLELSLEKDLGLEKGHAGLRGTSRGDAYVETLVETPVNLTKGKELLKEFSADGNSRGPQTDSFSEKLKDSGAVINKHLSFSTFIIVIIYV